MFTSFALLMPFCVCVLCTLLFTFKRHKSVPQQLMLFLNMLCALFFFADSLLIDSSNSGSIGWFPLISITALRQFLGPILLPLLLLFVRSMIRANYYSWTTGFWFTPPVMLGSVCFVLLSLMEPDTAQEYVRQLNGGHEPSGIFASDFLYRLHYIFAQLIYVVIMMVEMLYVMGYLIYLMVHSGYTLKTMSKLFRTDGSVPVVNLLAPVLITFLVVTGIRLGIGREFLLSNLWFAATCNLLLAALVLVANYLMLYANRSPITLRMLRSPLSSADSSKRYHYAAENGSLQTPVEGMSAISYAELIDGFKALVLVERIYLETAITIEDVATRLHSNRTYVSCMVSKEFGMSFRDYLATLRVQHAQEYMKAHNTATQEEVAQASGFASASTFNKKFRQVVGVSPRQWQINN